MYKQAMPTVADFRKNLSRYSREAQRGAYIYVTKHGRKAVALVPADVAAIWERKEDEKLAQAAKREAKRMRGRKWTYVKDARDLI